MLIPWLINFYSKRVLILFLFDLGYFNSLILTFSLISFWFWCSCLSLVLSWGFSLDLFYDCQKSCISTHLVLTF